MLCGGLVVLLVCAFYMSFSQTLASYTEFKTLEEKNKSIKSLTRDLQHWQSLNHQIDQSFGGQDVLSGFQEALLGSVGLFCEKHNLVFTEYLEPFEGVDGGYRVETIVIRVQGDFKSLLKLLHYLQTSFKAGKVSSAEFLKERNFKKNKDELYLKMYVQKVRKDEKK